MVILHVIEEGGEAHGPGPGARDDPRLGEQTHPGRGIRGGEHHDRRALLRMRRDLGLEAPLPGAGDQVLGQRRGDAPDRRHPDLVDVVEPAELGVDRRERRRAKLEAPRVVVKLEPPGVEGELVPVPEPPGDAGHEPACQLLPRVQEHHARAAEQPLEAARGEEVDPAGVHLHGYLPHRLVGIDQAERAARVGSLGHGGDVLDRSAREVDVGRRHERGALVHRPGDHLHRHGDLIRALDDDELDPPRPLREPLVGDRGEVERGDDDPTASALPQGAQGAGIEVDLVPEDRELAPIAGERMGAGLAGRREAACERHRRSIYRRSRGLDTARDDTRPLHRACRLQTAMRTPTSWPSLSLRLALRALANPRLAVDLLRLAWSFRARGWYRHPPFLPLPPREYIRWRMFTAYGDEAAVPPLEDVVRFARWRREVMHV